MDETLRLQNFRMFGYLNTDALFATAEDNHVKVIM